MLAPDLQPAQLIGTARDGSVDTMQAFPYNATMPTEINRIRSVRISIHQLPVA